MTRRLGWGICVTTLVAIIGAALAATVDTPSKQTGLVVGCVLVAIGLTMSALLALEDRATEFVSALRNFEGKIEQSFVKSGDLIGKAMRLQEVFKVGECESELRKVVGSLIRTKENRHPFFFDRAQEQVRELRTTLATVESGQYACKEDEEPLLTRDIVSACTSSLEAVSFQDEPWWKSAVGQVYLDRHRQLKSTNANFRMVRVFLFKYGDGIPAELADILRQHLELGVETYLLDPEAVPEEYRRDFVIYDNCFVRNAELVSPGQLGKQAEFVDSPDAVRRARSAFDLVLDFARVNGTKVTEVPA